MAGIASLAPGQAQQGPMPGMMPKPQGVQPGVPALVPSLVGMDMGQLLQMFADPNNPVPKNRLLAAMTEKQKEMAARQAVQGQMAMSQAQQQPGTVKDQVVQGAMQAAQPTQMAAHGGIMQGYAGGGAVAFQSGGPVQKFQYGAGPRGIMAQPPMLTSIDGLPIYAPGPDRTPGETEAEYQARKQRETAEADEVANRPLRRLYNYVAEKIRAPSPVAQMRTPAAQAVAPTAVAAEQITDTGDELTRMLGRAPAPVPMSMRDTRGAIPAPSAAPVKQRTRAADAVKPGISSLVGPEIDPYELEGRNAAVEYQTALQKAAQLSPEQVAARQKIDAAMGGRKRFLGTEEQRRESLAEKRLQEAVERSRVKPLDDITFVGQMLEGMKGAKRFGEGLAGLASGAGKAQAGRESAMRSAEEKYDISRNELFKLQDLRNQIDMDEAKLSEARATGDADKINTAAAAVAKSKMDYAKLQSDINDRALGRKIEREKIDVERDKIRAMLEGTQAGRDSANQQRLMTLMANAEARKQELVRKTTDDFKEANKQVYLMTSLPGAKVTPEMLEQRKSLDRQLATKIRAATADLDKIIAQAATQIPGFGALYGTSGGGLPAGVTVEKLP